MDEQKDLPKFTGKIGILIFYIFTVQLCALSTNFTGMSQVLTGLLRFINSC